jgi:hypothetical protein
MFQIAALESMAKDYDLKTNYGDVVTHLKGMKEHERTPTYNPYDYLTMFKNFNWPSKIGFFCEREINVPFCYEHIVPQNGDRFIGYFQSEKYFKHNREYILNLFEPYDFLKYELNKYRLLFENKRTCSIHVRRGDYLNYSETHLPQKIDYFTRAIDRMDREDDVDVYVVFSDDIQWCKENFKGDAVFGRDNFYFIENEKDYIELYLMSMCNNHIVSNSSFSWWGAWLDNKESKVVIAPKKWWIGEDEDVVPETWIKI